MVFARVFLSTGFRGVATGLLGVFGLLALARFLALAGFFAIIRFLTIIAGLFRVGGFLGIIIPVILPLFGR